MPYAKHVEKLRRRLNSRLPLIGAWWRKRALHALIEDSGSDAISALTEAIVSEGGSWIFREILTLHLQEKHFADLTTRSLAEVLGNLKNDLRFQSLVNDVWAKWRETKDHGLEHILVSGRYVADQPEILHALSCLKTGQRKRLEGVGQDIVPHLLVAAKFNDKFIAAESCLALANLKQADAREEVCRIAIEKGSEIARDAAITGKYAPRDEKQRALFFFLTEQWQRYEALDFDRRLLLEIYETASPTIRKQITDKMRIAGRTDFLTVIAGHHLRKKTGGMTPDETNLLIQMLESNREWLKLWELVFELPFAWSTRALGILVRSGWKQETDQDRAVFETLAGIASRTEFNPQIGTSLVLPPAVMQSSARILGRINSVAFSPKRPALAIGTGNRSLGLWNFQTNSLEAQWRGFGHSLGRVAFMASGTLLCAERTNGWGQCAVYYYTGGEMQPLTQHSGSITGIEPISDSEVMISGRDQKTRLWNVNQGVIAAEHEIDDDFDDDWPRGLCVSTKGNKAALLHRGITVLSLPSLQVSASYPYANGISRSACFFPNDGGLVVGKVNGEVTALLQSGDSLRPDRGALYRHAKEVKGVKFLNKRSILVTAGAEGSVQFTSWTNRMQIGSVSVPGQRLTSIEVSPDEDFMAVGDSDASVSLWDLRVMDIPALFALPFSKATPAHLAAVRAAASDAALSEGVSCALQYLECVLEYRFRYDIELDELWSIKRGDFDIEIEG